MVETPVIIYTDGSSFIANKGQTQIPKRYFASYAFVVPEKFIISGSGESSIYYQESGAKEPLKTNGGELLAVVRAVQWAMMEFPKREIRIFSDSAYVVNSFNQYLDFWATGGHWENGSGEPIANKKYWQTLFKLKEELRKEKTVFKLIHIKGHSGNYFNDVADELAKYTMKSYRNKKLNSVPLIK